MSNSNKQVSHGWFLRSSAQFPPRSEKGTTARPDATMFFRAYDDDTIVFARHAPFGRTDVLLKPACVRFTFVCNHSHRSAPFPTLAFLSFAMRVSSCLVVYIPFQVGLSMWLLFALVAEAPSIAAQVLGAR